MTEYGSLESASRTRTERTRRGSARYDKKLHGETAARAIAGCCRAAISPQLRFKHADAPDECDSAGGVAGRHYKW